MRCQAQAEEQRAIGQRDARGVVEGEVGRGARRAVAVLDEDRREPRDHEQRRWDQTQQLAVSRAQHACERTSLRGAGTPTGSLPYDHVRAAGGTACARPTPYAQTAADTPWMTSVLLHTRAKCGCASRSLRC